MNFEKKIVHSDEFDILTVSTDRPFPHIHLTNKANTGDLDIELGHIGFNVDDAEKICEAIMDAARYFREKGTP